jgi:uncharacterized protein YjbJ (UPF0337 family)
MGNQHKLNNTKQNAKGKAKEAWGDATDNEQLQAQGRFDQSNAKLKQAGEKVKDAFRR